ncbi:MAG: hypothetical protein KDD67_13440 [Ignavibacteriae bacterium]|nr:hypothetical protein [Ignavibacteriota bacterium]MCB9217102.1 hypothetical protein [Ignavibacteria bacterium]
MNFDFRHCSTLWRCSLALTLFFIQLSSAEGQIVESWKVFSALDRSTSAAVDLDGNVWVGSSGGAYRYNPADNSLEEFRTDDGLFRLNVSAVGVDPTSGDIYFGSNNGAISILRSSGRWNYVTDIARSSQTLKAINGFYFANNLIYILTEFGVGVFDPTDSTIRDSWIRLGSIPPNSSVSDLVFFNDSVWVATPFGIASAPLTGRNLADPLSWHSYDGDAMCGEGEATSLQVVEGNLMVGTTDGVCEYRNGTFTRRGDIGGRIHFASNSTDVVAANDNRLYTYQPGSGFKEVGATPRRVMAVTLLPGGEPVAVMEQDGIAYVKSNAIETFVPNGPSSNKFADLTFGADRDLWVATNAIGDGVNRLSTSDSKWSAFTSRNRSDFTSESIWRINADDRGRIWVSSFGDGLFIFNPEKGTDGSEVDIVNYNETNSPLRGTSSDADYVICADAKPSGDGVTWFINWDNTPGIRGAVLLANTYNAESNSDQFFLFPATNAFGSSITRSYIPLTIDFNQTVWIGSDRAEGILYFSPGETLDDPGEWGRMTTTNDLLSNTISALLVDPDGELWIGTPAGATVLVNPETVARNGSENAIFREIRALEDVVVRDIVVDALNRKWIATDKGVFVLTSDGTELLSTFTEENSPLVSNDVLVILADDVTGQIYVGTSAGLNRLQTEAIAPKNNLEQIVVSPQPFFVGVDQSLRITGLPSNSTVKILKLDGALITEFRAPGGDVAFWNGRDVDGEFVATGVYLVSARSPLGETVVGKIAVVRQ